MGPDWLVWAWNQPDRQAEAGRLREHQQGLPVASSQWIFIPAAVKVGKVILERRTTEEEEEEEGNEEKDMHRKEDEL